jgi:hypothetical protein
MALLYLGYALIDAGRHAEAIEILRRAHEVTQGMPWSAEGVALAQGLCGIEERDVLLPWLKFMPCFDRLHGHPRFQAVLSRVVCSGHPS